MLFFEADEDGSPHIYLAAGLSEDQFDDDETIEVKNAPTTFGILFGYRLIVSKSNKKITIEITQSLPSNISFVFPCYFGSGIVRAEADGQNLNSLAKQVLLPGGFSRAEIVYG